MNRHTDSAYENELAALNSSFALMGARAAGMVRDAVRALFTRDPELGRKVVSLDAELDQLEKDTDRQCLVILARRAPVGADLRFVTSILKATTDVERVGDLAVNLAERALELMGEPGAAVVPDERVQALADGAIALLERSLHAFRTQDAPLARQLIAEDRAIDALNRAAFHHILALTAAHPTELERGLALASVCRYLERVGDHSANLCERAVFLVVGEDIRHLG